MKKTILYAASVAFLALGMTACGSATEEAVTYELDATATTLEWKGDYADGTHSHTGTIALADGSMTFAGETFEKGSFNADLSTIKSELTPNQVKGYLSQLSQKGLITLWAMEDQDSQVHLTLEGCNILLEQQNTELEFKQINDIKENI